MDLRAGRSHAKRYLLSEQKIGSVSVNPVRPYFLVTASNTRDLKCVSLSFPTNSISKLLAVRVWDTRMLETLSGRSRRSAPSSPGPSTPRSPSKRQARSATVFAQPTAQPTEVDSGAIEKLVATKRGESTVRARWAHGKSVSSAYWDPRGRSIVSTSYDDTIRCGYSIDVLSSSPCSLPPSMGHQAFVVRQGCAVPIITTVRPNQAQLPDCQSSRCCLMLLCSTWSRLAGKMAHHPQSPVDTEPRRVPPLHGMLPPCCGPCIL